MMLNYFLATYALVAICAAIVCLAAIIGLLYICPPLGAVLVAVAFGCYLIIRMGDRPSSRADDIDAGT